MTDRSDLVIGIDGGGTGCRIAISAAGGSVIGTATAGAANYTSDRESTVTHILAALSDAANSAGLPLDSLLDTPAHLGLAGIVTPEDAKSLAARLPLTHCRVTDDQVTSTIGALGARDGALVAVGTGSFVAIKRGDTIRTLGGWGLHLGDQASGAWLGRTALQRCALVADGLAPTSPLVAELLARFDNDAGQMIAFARIAPPAEYAQFAPLIFEAAQSDDPNACSLIIEGAAYLNLCLGTADLEGDDVLCMGGGLGPRYAPWLDVRYQSRIAEPEGTALDGAVRLAWHLAERN
ncbi:MAG: BadF/BadG/BcrA/BcrD ATPase family protein [Pelagibaca sp.]